LDCIHGLRISLDRLGVYVSLVWRLSGFAKTLVMKEIVKIYDYNQPGLRGMRGRWGLGIHNTLGIAWGGWTVEEWRSL